MEWNIHFLGTEEELWEENYDRSIEWVELHRTDGERRPKIKLVKFRESKKENNNGYVYYLAVKDPEMKIWAAENCSRFHCVGSKYRTIYKGQELGNMMEFIEEIKANA